LLRDADADVRLRAAQGLTAAGVTEAVPVLIGLLTDGPPETAWRAEELLERLAGKEAPPLAATGEGAARARWRDAWAGWWREYGECLDLAGAARGPQQLGLTLCVEWNTGRVYEVGWDGKLRWQLNISGPMDAQVLPGGRVLIAEAGARRVTERDLKGNVLWEVAVESEPISCRRLPSGNTFIGTRDGVREVTRDGQVAVRHQAEGSPYFHGVSRMRNGHYVYITNDGLIVELNAAGRKVRTVQVPREGSWGAVEALPGGRYLVCNYGTGRVLEVNGAGKVLWERTVPGACGVVRLPSGNTLLGCSDRAVEIDRAGKVVWERSSDGFVRRIHRR
jgi:hypothetical protein